MHTHPSGMQLTINARGRANAIEIDDRSLAERLVAVSKEAGNQGKVILLEREGNLDLCSATDQELIDQITQRSPEKWIAITDSHCATPRVFLLNSDKITGLAEFRPGELLVAHTMGSFVTNVPEEMEVLREAFGDPGLMNNAGLPGVPRRRHLR